MTLEKINLVISTVWREENYLDATLKSLTSEYPTLSDPPVCLVVGSPVTAHLDRYRMQPGMSVVEMGPNTWSFIKNNHVVHRAAWNYYRCLTQPPSGERGTLVFEDDVRFARGWRNRLNAALVELEDRFTSNFVLSLYARQFLVQEAYQSGLLYVEFPFGQFIGTQGIYFPSKIRQGFAKYLKAHGVVANTYIYDFLLREYLMQSGIPLFATAPCLVQHIGKISAIQYPWHETANFLEDVTEGATTSFMEA